MQKPDLLAASIQGVTACTQQMLAAARDGDWDRLIRLELERRGHFARWADIRKEGESLPDSSRENILAIQAMDTEIQQLAAARSTHLKEELAVTVKRQKLMQLYR